MTAKKPASPRSSPVNALIDMLLDGLQRAEVWALVMLLVGAGLAVFLYRGLGRDVVIPLTFIYAYVGVIVRYYDVPLVLVGAIIGAISLAALSVLHFRGGARYELQTTN